ncbi:Intracellular growth attenuator protein IgaA [compost metagenome]
MEGEGRCEIDMSGRAEAHTTSGVPVIDCTSVRWNGTAPVVPSLDIPPGVLALAEPGFLRATENHAMASLIAMLRMQQMGGQASDPLAAYRVRESVPLTVRGFDRSAAMIDAACKDAAGLSPAACERLQRELVRAIDATVDKDGVETPVNTWQALATSAAAGKENADLVLSRQQLASVQRALAQAVDSVVATKIEAALPAIVPAQGGVLLASPTRIGNARVQAPGEGSDDVSAAGAPVADVAEDDTDSSLLARWTRLQRNATAEGLKPFTLEGLVTASGKDTTGTPWVRVDPSLDASRMTAAGAHVLWWLFAAGLVLVNGVLFGLRWTQDSRRRDRLETDIATRPAPGTGGLF